MLTRLQREVLVGILLGDAWLETQNAGRTFRLGVLQSEKHVEYVDHLFDVFKSFIEVPGPKLRERLDYSGNVYRCYQFRTRSSGEFRFYYHQFYLEGVKVVPELVHRWLCPRTLAYWYMDDGALKSKVHKTIIFNTQCFDLASVNRLSEAIKFRYGWTTSVHKQRNTHVLYLHSEYAFQFFNLCGEYIIDSMKYKIPPKLTEMPKE